LERVLCERTTLLSVVPFVWSKEVSVSNWEGERGEWARRS
jgi:hypothetical protein